MLTVFWSGRGYVAALIIGAVLLATEYITEQWYGDEMLYQSEWWPITMALFISGALVHFLNRKLLGAEYLEHPANKRHTLFFIDLKHWPPILLVLGVLFGLYVGTVGPL